MAAAQQRTGRPTKAAAPGTRASLGLKVTPDVKQRLDAAARGNGRTQSQEAEARLERSFQDELLLPQLMDLAFGRQTAGLLLLIGECLRDTLPSAVMFAGGKLAATPPDWMHSPWVFRQVEEAIRTILEGLEPPGTGDAITPGLIKAMPAEPLRRGMERLGAGFATGALASLFGDPEEAGHLEQRLRPARERLASIIAARKQAADDAG